MINKVLPKAAQLLSVLVTLTVLVGAAATSVSANDEPVICPQPYGGGVVCGVKTHEPVKAGLAENIGLIGIVTLGASAYLRKLAKNAKDLA